jgi:hypothetical protein
MKSEQPPNTKALVERFRTAYRSSGKTLSALSVQFGGIISAQGLTEILHGRANPTSEQTLAILNFLKSPKENSTMSSSLISDVAGKRRSPDLNAPELPEPAVNLLEDSPKNLASAKEMISALRVNCRSVAPALRLLQSWQMPRQRPFRASRCPHRRRNPHLYWSSPRRLRFPRPSLSIRSAC